VALNIFWVKLAFSCLRFFLVSSAEVLPLHSEKMRLEFVKSLLSCSTVRMINTIY